MYSCVRKLTLVQLVVQPQTASRHAVCWAGLHPCLPHHPLPASPLLAMSSRRGSDSGGRQPLPRGCSVPVPPARRPPLHSHRWVECLLRKGRQWLGSLSFEPAAAPAANPANCTLASVPLRSFCLGSCYAGDMRFSPSLLDNPHVQAFRQVGCGWPVVAPGICWPACSLIADCNQLRAACWRQSCLRAACPIIRKMC